ncbi:MAG TPA: acetyl-CoA carboxylase biotin carboxyl carrier protein [bacterium]|nr:acetyl-CoA carboxylase biotin carboxyl carrier protein [bacterium]
MRKKKSKNSSNKKAKELVQIREFVNLVKDADITELLWENDGTKISFKRGAPNLDEQKESAQKEAGAYETFPSSPKTEEGSSQQKEEILPFSEKYTIIKSHMVGTFYNSLSEDQSPLVKVKDVIKPGQKICVIEAMKIMREISADKGGKVVKILVEDGHPVEYGQDMFLIDPYYEREGASKSSKKRHK